MFHWKLMIAMIVLILFIFINKRESFEDISRNILIDKSLTNVHGKTLIDLKNDDLITSNLGYISQINTENTNYPLQGPILTDKTIQKDAWVAMYDGPLAITYTAVQDTLKNASEAIGTCLTKYYSFEYDSSKFTLFGQNAYRIEPVTAFIEILNRLKASFARTMNAINIHNFNIEKSCSGSGLAKMRMSIFKTLIDRTSSNSTKITLFSANRASRYTIDQSYPTSKIDYTNGYYKGEQNGDKDWNGKYQKNPYTEYNTTYSYKLDKGINLTFQGEHSNYNDTNTAGHNYLPLQNSLESFIGYNLLFKNNNNRNMFYSYFSNQNTSNIVALLEKYINMDNWQYSINISGDNEIWTSSSGYPEHYTDEYGRIGYGNRAYLGETYGDQYAYIMTIGDGIGYYYIDCTGYGTTFWCHASATSSADYNITRYNDGGLFKPLTPNLLKPQVEITPSNFTIASYYNKISIGTQIFDVLILKYQTVVTDKITLNPITISVTNDIRNTWLTNNSSNSVAVFLNANNLTSTIPYVNWSTLYTTQT